MVDRNLRAVEQFKTRAQTRAFQAALGDGRVAATDQMQRPLVPGDLVHVDSPQARVFQIASVEPVLDPTMPTGTLRVILQADLTVFISAGAPMTGVLLVLPREVAAAASAGPAAAAAPTGETPDTPAPAITLTDGD